MTKRVALQFIFYATALVAIALAVNQSLATDYRRTALLHLSNRRAGLERQLESTQSLTGIVAAKSPTENQGGGIAEKAKAPRRPGKIPVDTTESMRSEMIEALLNNPKLQSLYLDSQRATLGGLYAPLVRQLGLSTEQAAQFYDRVMERNEQRMDLADVMHSSGTTLHDPLIAALEEKNSGRFRAAQTSLLGPDGYRQLQEYERALPVWEVVNRFAGVAALEGLPLDLHQASQLTELMAKSSPPYRAGGIADTNNLEWNSILGGSRQMLTSAQHRSFLNMAPRYPVTDPQPRAPPP